MDLRLTQYQQTIDVVTADATYEPITFSGAAPVLVRTVQRFKTVVQAGRAVGWGVAMIPPDPIAGTLIAPPEVKVARIDPVQYETTWTYTLAVEASVAVDPVAAAAWPSEPKWYEDPYA